MATKYIETRKTWIKAIHKCIVEKWNPICMGCVEDESPCNLCEKARKTSSAAQSKWNRDYCSYCPLEMAGDRCESHKGSWREWSLIANAWPFEPAPAEAEAMLEALVQLLPESERTIYGG